MVFDDSMDVQAKVLNRNCDSSYNVNVLVNAHKINIIEML